MVSANYVIVIAAVVIFDFIMAQFDVGDQGLLCNFILKQSQICTKCDLIRPSAYFFPIRQRQFYTKLVFQRILVDSLLNLIFLTKAQ